MKELAQGLGVPLTRMGKGIVASRPNGKNCRQGCQEIAKDGLEELPGQTPTASGVNLLRPNVG